MAILGAWFNAIPDNDIQFVCVTIISSPLQKCMINCAKIHQLHNTSSTINRSLTVYSCTFGRVHNTTALETWYYKVLTHTVNILFNIHTLACFNLVLSG